MNEYLLIRNKTTRKVKRHSGVRVLKDNILKEGEGIKTENYDSSIVHLTIAKCELLNYLPVSRVMPLKVFNEHLVYAVGSRWVAAGVPHRAPTSIEILPHYHRNFPQTWIGSRGTGWYHAVVEELVIQRVRPARRSVLIDGHRGVVRKVRVPQHLEHVVSSDL